MKRIVLRAEAEREALDAYEWYEGQREGLGLEFRDALDATLRDVAEQPQAFPVMLRDTRRARLKRFPYAVFYREHDDALIVVAVFHGRRDPMISKGRT